MAVSLRDVVLHAGPDASYVVVSHGGCPDGAAAAIIMKRALQAVLGLSSPEVQVVEQRHAARNTESVDADAKSILFFVDISPTLADVPVLQTVRRVVVLDHHASVVAEMEKLKGQVRQLLDLSVVGKQECGASLVQEFVGKDYVLDKAVLELVWKLDVFEHTLPADYEHLLHAFKGWVSKDGFHNTSVELMTQLVDSKDACLHHGAKLFEPILTHTQEVFNRRQMVHDCANFCIMLVMLVDDASLGLDPPTYQSMIDETEVAGKATVFATVSRIRDMWNVGLRRAGTLVDLGRLAIFLRDEDSLGIISGGGHPFAAACQSCATELDEATLVRALRAGVTHCISAAVS